MSGRIIFRMLPSPHFLSHLLPHMSRYRRHWNWGFATSNSALPVTFDLSMASIHLHRQFPFLLQDRMVDDNLVESLIFFLKGEELTWFKVAWLRLRLRLRLHSSARSLGHVVSCSGKVFRSEYLSPLEPLRVSKLQASHRHVLLLVSHIERCVVVLRNPCSCPWNRDLCYEIFDYSWIRFRVESYTFSLVKGFPALFSWFLRL